MTNRLSAPALDPESATRRTGSTYPKQFQQQLADRNKRVLGDPLGLSHFGVNLVELGPTNPTDISARATR